MNARHRLISLAAFCAIAAQAQTLGVPVLGVSSAPAYEGARAGFNATDQITLDHADQSRNRLEVSLKDYLVAFDSQLAKERHRVGLPLASFANNRLDFAYDLSGKNVMAQWHLNQPTAYGQRWDYQAYVGASGTFSFVISSRF